MEDQLWGRQYTIREKSSRKETTKKKNENFLTWSKYFSEKLQNGWKFILSIGSSTELLGAQIFGVIWMSKKINAIWKSTCAPKC